MGISVFSKGFNYSQDGRGNRLVYHLKGCNLRCPWCSNPEGMDFARQASEFTPSEEIISEVIRSKPMFFDGGGVTFTGGEATIQFEELKEIITKIKDLGISVAIETNGTCDRLAELFPLLDELIMDFKHYDSEYHRKITGLSNDIIKKNLELAFREHKNLLVRIPLINGFNASEKDMKEFSRFFSKFDTKNARFEILCYHEYGKAKWEKCGKIYTVENGFITEETRNHFETMLRESGLNIVRT